MHTIRHKYWIYLGLLLLYVCHSSLGVSIPCLNLIKIQRESQMCSYDNKPFSLVPSLWGFNSLLHIWCSKLITTPRAGFLRGPVSRIWQDVIGIIQSDKGLEATCTNRKTPMKRWLSDSFIFNCKLVPYICVLSIKRWIRRLLRSFLSDWSHHFNLCLEKEAEMRQQVSFVFLHRGRVHLCFSNGPSSGPWHGDEDPALPCVVSKSIDLFPQIRQRKYFNLCWFIWESGPPAGRWDSTSSKNQYREMEMSRHREEHDLQQRLY